MKKLTSFILVITLVMSIFVPSSVVFAEQNIINDDTAQSYDALPNDTTPTDVILAFMYGDINNDKEVTSADALAVLQFSVQKITLTEAQQAAADVTAPLGVSSNDALAVLQFAVGKIDEFTPPSSGFVIVIPHADAALDYQADRIENALTALNKKVDIITDIPADISASQSIMLGDIDFATNKEYMAQLSENQWKIQGSHALCSIVGWDNKTLDQAVDAFLETTLAEMVNKTTVTTLSGTYVPPVTLAHCEDHSTGAVNPRLVNTKFATEDIVIADIIVTDDGYAVNSEGKGDSTAGIQKALNDCAKAGGGTVYLPAGTYNITGTITIPARVTLRGDWNNPNENNEYGTIVFAYVSSEDSITTGLFMLGGSGGVYGLAVYYPEQDLSNVKPYPFTFYTTGSGDSYMLSTVKNVTVINGYRGLGACCLNETSPAHEQFTIDNVYGTFLKNGAEIYNQADVGTWQEIHISPKYWANANPKYATFPEKENDITDYTKANGIGFILGDLEWTEFVNMSVKGYSIGMSIVKGKRIEFAGSLYQIRIEDCTQGILVNSMDSRWGMLISNSYIEGGIKNKVIGIVKLCYVEVKGTISGNVKPDTTNPILDTYVIDPAVSYQKPVSKLYIASLPTSGDASEALQATLNSAKETGGVVYVPAGVYRFDQPVNVPAGVELRGNSSVATRESSGGGTLFQVYYGDGENFTTDDTAFITLGEGAGVNGLRIIYPQNGPYDTNHNTTYTIRGTGKNVYVVNASIAASGYGVDFRNCDNHFIEKVTSCCYFNTFNVGGKNGVIAGCLQNATAMLRTAAPNLEQWDGADLWTMIFDTVLRPNLMHIVVDGATNQVVYNTFGYGCNTLITCKNSTDLLAVNVGCDNIGGTQTQMESGSAVLINTMRYNGTSFNHVGGKLAIYNRLTINDKKEETYFAEK